MISELLLLLPLLLKYYLFPSTRPTFGLSAFKMINDRLGDHWISFEPWNFKSFTEQVNLVIAKILDC
jgi:hypothetical protein